MSLAFELQDQDGAADQQDGIRTPVFQGQLILENCREIAGRGVVAEDFANLALEGCDRVVPCVKLLARNVA